jgi:23S rRNA G2445 N2-methylase RlmL
MSSTTRFRRRPHRDHRRKKYGARGIGVDIDPEQVLDARENARAAGFSDRVEFREGNLFEMDLRDVDT